MARRNKPTALKIVDNTPGASGINYDEPDLGHIDRSPPDDLGKEGKRCWRMAIKECPEGMLATMDFSVLHAWCVATEHYRELQKAWNEDGRYIILTPTGQEKANPLLRAIREEGRVMLKTADQLGFSPTARAKLHTGKSDVKGKGKNAFTRYA